MYFHRKALCKIQLGGQAEMSTWRDYKVAWLSYGNGLACFMVTVTYSDGMSWKLGKLKSHLLSYIYIAWLSLLVSSSTNALWICASSQRPEKIKWKAEVLSLQNLVGEKHIDRWFKKKKKRHAKCNHRIIDAGYYQSRKKNIFIHLTHL